MTFIFPLSNYDYILVEGILTVFAICYATTPPSSLPFFPLILTSCILSPEFPNLI